MSNVGLVAKAIAEVAKVVGNWQVSRERRRLKVGLEAAEKYIFVNEQGGEFKDISVDRKWKLLAHYRKRFFAHN